MKKTHMRLSDGRELIYFDESDTVTRNVTDPRPLAAPAFAGELRYDAVLDEWVAMAGHRQQRTYLPPDEECPLCPSTEGRHTEIPSSDYDVVVFENRFPTFASPATGTARAGGGSAAATDAATPGGQRAVHAKQAAPSQPQNPAETLHAQQPGPSQLQNAAAALHAKQPAPSQPQNPAETLHAQQPAVGRCEVVCYTSDHNATLADLPLERIRTVVEAWVDRTIALSALPHVEQVFCFENYGREIGVTLRHPHGQIYAYPFVTPRTRRMMDSAREYRERTWCNLFADLLAQELRTGERVIVHTEYWTAFVPFAARWPLEVHIYPNRQLSGLPELSEAERADFCHVYLNVLGRMTSLYAHPIPYISAWHQAPVRIDRELSYLHLQIHSAQRSPTRLKYLAGSESAMGAFINDVLPEEAARTLREARL